MAKQFSDSEIETILRSYPRLKGQSDIIREQLFGLFPSCVGCGNDGLPKAIGKISRQTENYGIKNAVNREYLESKVSITVGQVRSIEIAFEALPSNCRDMVKYYYYEKLKKYEVQAKLFLSDEQFRYRRREILDTVNEILSTTLEQHEKNTILTI